MYCVEGASHGNLLKAHPTTMSSWEDPATISSLLSFPIQANEELPAEVVAQAEICRQIQNPLSRLLCTTAVSGALGIGIETIIDWIFQDSEELEELSDSFRQQLNRIEEDIDEINGRLNGIDNRLNGIDNRLNTDGGGPVLGLVLGPPPSLEGNRP